MSETNEQQPAAPEQPESMLTPPASKLKAMPGRKYAIAERVGAVPYGELIEDIVAAPEWTVSAVAGQDKRIGVPAMPIASFYGPEAEHDAKLFTAACELYETNHALSMMLAAFAQTVELVTEGQIDLAADTDYTRLMAAARLARMQATGVEVVEVSGTSTKRHNAEAFDRCRMPIREAFGLTLREDIKITRVSRVGRQDALVANELTT